MGDCSTCHERVKNSNLNEEILIKAGYHPQACGSYATCPDAVLKPWYGGRMFAAAGDFLRNYRDMRDANTIGADKYFHCKANCEASQGGEYGKKMAEKISDGREWFDQKIKGSPASDSVADQIANRAGREGAGSGSCSKVCEPFRPKGLSEKY